MLLLLTTLLLLAEAVVGLLYKIKMEQVALVDLERVQVYLLLAERHTQSL
jgi:hypothetical protein